ncbi:tryptophan-rich sensory protein [Candidatus Gracilibacteria bacterium]|nr:tryptophan-rich sensory protein [Candidatus Gracilibacteria bacterium]
MIRYLLLISALLTIGLTTLVSIPGSPYLIGGMTQADISAMFATSVTPAGFTFAIWSLIYLSWIIVGAYVAFFKKGNAKIDTKSLILFSLAIFLTALWLIPWGNLWISTSLVIMLAILSLLAYVFSRTRSENTIIRSSIDITLGWIIMATALNVTVWMRYIGWSLGGATDIYYAIFALGAILLIVSELQCRYRTYIISGVFLWTLFGVYMAHPILEIQGAVVIYAVTIGLYIIQSLRNKKTALNALKFW